MPVMWVPGFEVASGDQAAGAYAMGFVKGVSEKAVLLGETREQAC
jgi:hypothetical protein